MYYFLSLSQKKKQAAAEKLFECESDDSDSPEFILSLLHCMAHGSFSLLLMYVVVLMLPFVLFGRFGFYKYMKIVHLTIIL